MIFTLKGNVEQLVLHGLAEEYIPPLPSIFLEKLGVERDSSSLLSVDIIISLQI